MSGIHFERTYPHPIEHVWEAIATARGLSAWLMPTDFEPRAGHRFQFRWKKVPGWRGFVDCEVLAIEPMHRLTFSWKGEEGQKPTTVTFRLEAVGDGTRLIFDHTGFEGIGGFFSRLMMTNGWRKKMLDRQLTAALATLTQRGPEALVALVP
ncbi:MAG: SRPBCC domain-containing protein [Candidatus Eisenbacteria bacterium]|uniref:SRPBCC domain-containing protein n=1 Tax=Eiseniibacteriota bacterium TaxID=2212470 RepID=A0A956LZ76_UNCEI|nr:SRPBCC domain-containing protein [Candidatus Eisenbacteria bacterium]